MSLDSMADDFVTRKASGHLQTLMMTSASPQTVTALKNATAVTPAGANVSADNSASQSVQSLTKYIPTEVVTLYVGLLGLVPNQKPPVAGQPQPDYDPYLWAIFGICLLLCVFGEFVLTRAKGAAVTGGDWRELPWFPMVASVIAFVAWSAVLPNSIIAKNVLGDATWVGFAAVLIVTVVLTMVNNYLNTQANVKAN